MNSYEFLLKRLRAPQGKVDVVLDTDTYNEVDDQFAVAYMVASEDKLNIKGIYLAPFRNEKAETPAIGMEKSYQEIGNILTLCKREDLKALVHRGSEQFLLDENTPVESEGLLAIWFDWLWNGRRIPLCMYLLSEQSPMWHLLC